MNLPKVSIVTPSFNQEKYIAETIESVISQDYPDLEYIIIDGASTDNSVEIIKDYADKYPFIKWVSEKDRGQSHAINKGFKMCVGEIVAWLNSDDTYEPGAIHAQARFLADNPDIDLVYGDAGITDEAGNLKEMFPYAEEFDLQRLININAMIMQPSAFWRRSLFEKIGYLDESLCFTMDWDFWIRAGKAARLKYNPRHIANTREYTTTKTFGGGFPRMREIRKIIDKYSDKRYPPLYRNFFYDTIYKYIYRLSPKAAVFLKKILLRLKKRRQA